MHSERNETIDRRDIAYPTVGRAVGGREVGWARSAWRADMPVGARLLCAY